MKKTLLSLFVSLVVISGHCYAETEVITDFDSKGIPVLNEELRKLDKTNTQVSDRVTALESSTTSTATQAEVEAASSTTTYVSPGRTQNHPGVAKAWAVFSDTGTISTSYNVTSVSHNGTGEYTIVWGTDFSGANYFVSGTAQRGAAGCIIVGVKTGVPTAATSCTIETRSAADVLEDPTKTYIMAMGDQ